MNGQYYLLNHTDEEKLNIGVSACLLGNEVRFDGGHKHAPFITRSLSRYANFMSVCPEVEAGFSTPRPAMQLRKNSQVIRLVISQQQSKDVTEQMTQYAHKKVKDLGGLDGYIFKKKLSKLWCLSCPRCYQSGWLP